MADKHPPPKTQIQVWLDPTIANQIRTLATDLGVSLSAAAGILIRRGLATNKDQP